MTTGTFDDRRLRLAGIVGLGIVVILAVLHINAVYMAIGPLTYLWVYDVVNIVMAAVSSVLAFLLWRSFDRSEPHKVIWGMLGLGLLLWTIGELIWAIYELILHQEIPYPSVADAAWVIGYVPLLIALFLRFRSLRQTPSRGQLIAVLSVVVVIVILAVVFVIGPIVTYTGYERPIEQVLDALYPIGDLMVAVGTLFSVLALAGGTLSRSWGFIAAGFLAVAVSDLLFGYASWNEIYMTGSMDPVTAVVNILYYTSYILIALGVYIQARIQRVA